MIVAKKGDKGTKVRVIQRLLNLIPDGIYGALTEEAVKDFQEQHGLKVDGIVGVATWQHLIVRTLKPAKRDIREIIVHCTATPAGRDYTVDDIRKWHLQRGFSDIGYHYVIYRDGSVHEGRPVTMAGAHCTGHNWQHWRVLCRWPWQGQQDTEGHPHTRPDGITGGAAH